MHWRIEGGGGVETCNKKSWPWPPTLNWLRCSKLDVVDQQCVVNSR